MKRIFFSILVIFSFGMGCSNVNVPYDNLLGFWEKEINNESGNQKFVLYIVDGKDGLECQFHSYNNNVKYSSEIGDDIEFDGKSLSFVANRMADVRYEGEINSTGNVIVGKLIYSNGSEQEFNLNKISDKKLESEFKKK